MSRRDLYHDIVVEALIADGWTITNDPLTLPIDDTNVQIDLAAERQLVGAKKGKHLIAVEIKSYVGQSVINEAKSLLGQLHLYSALLKIHDPERELVAAIPRLFHKKLEKSPMLYDIIDVTGVKKIIYDEREKRILLWKD